jgi:hypothetical protein
VKDAPNDRPEEIPGQSGRDAGLAGDDHQTGGRMVLVMTPDHFQEPHGSSGRRGSRTGRLPLVMKRLIVAFVSRIGIPI